MFDFCKCRWTVSKYTHIANHAEPNSYSVVGVHIIFIMHNQYNEVQIY